MLMQPLLLVGAHQAPRVTAKGSTVCAPHIYSIYCIVYIKSHRTRQTTNYIVLLHLAVQSMILGCALAEIEYGRICVRDRLWYSPETQE